MPAEPNLLSTDQMAQFVARGFLRLDGVVPDDINRQAIEELPALFEAWLQQFVAVSGSTPTGEALPNPTPRSGTQLAKAFDAGSAFGRMVRVPEVAGAIASLVGFDAVFDHYFAHLKPAGDLSAQRLHCDAIVDPHTAFDIQLFWFPHDVAPGEGGTRFVPGSHLHRSDGNEIGRYQHIVGDQFFSGPAGTVMIFHHGLWHAGAANRGGGTRVMGKLRLNPSRPQVRLWNTADLDARMVTDEHIFARTEPGSLASMLRERQPWYTEPAYRHELVQRATLWRYLTGAPSFDIDWYLTRLERRARLEASS
jgi:Phytanoyl-CoA dioxygenase (PhyH)